MTVRAFSRAMIRSGYTCAAAAPGTHGIATTASMPIARSLFICCILSLSDVRGPRSDSSRLVDQLRGGGVVAFAHFVDQRDRVLQQRHLRAQRLEQCLSC